MIILFSSYVAVVRQFLLLFFVFRINHLIQIVLRYLLHGLKAVALKIQCPFTSIDQSFPAYLFFEVQDPQAAFVGLLGMMATIDNLEDILSHCSINTVCPIDKAGSAPSGLHNRHTSYHRICDSYASQGSHACPRSYNDAGTVNSEHHQDAVQDTTPTYGLP